MSLQSHTNSSAYEKDVQTGSACCTPEGHGQRLTRAAINCGASDIRSFVWVKADQRLSMYSVALTTSLLRESLARCSRIQLSRSAATHGALSSCRTAPRCSPPWPLIERSISKQGVDAPDSHIELARQLLNPKLLMSDQGLIIDGSGSGHREFRFGMRRAGCFGGECRLQCFNVVRNCAGFLDLKSQAIHRPTTSQTRTLVQSQSIGSYLGADACVAIHSSGGSPLPRRHASGVFCNAPGVVCFTLDKWETMSRDKWETMSRRFGAIQK